MAPSGYLKGNNHNIREILLCNKLIKNSRDYALIVGSMTVGLGSFIWQRTPSGLIARQEYEKTLTRPMRLLRKTLPFACAVLPLYLMRSAIHDVKIPGFSK